MWLLWKFRWQKFIIVGQTADPDRPPRSAPLNGCYFIVTSKFQRHRVPLESELENTSKSLPHCVLGLHHNPSRLPPLCHLLSFVNPNFLRHRAHTWRQYHWPLCPVRLKRREEAGKEMCTWKPSKFRYGEAPLWSKDATISCEVQFCHVLNSTDECD